MMKFCNNCGKELEDTARFCSKCGVEQVDKKEEEAIVVDDPVWSPDSSKNTAISKHVLTNTEKDFASNMSIRQFFLEARKEEYNEQTAEKVKKFLEEKEIIELWPVAIIILEELGALYHQWERTKDDDAVEIAEKKKLYKEMKAEEEKFLDQFEKQIKDFNLRKKKVDRKSSGNEKDARHSYLEAAFKKINKNINALFGMKDETKGFWIFKSHKYSAKQLFESEEYHRIHVIAEKMADDLSNWKQNNQLDSYTKRVYNVNRELLVGRVSELEEAIKNREPTWWDKIKQFFSSLWQFISDTLPKLVLSLLLKMENMPGLIGSMGRGLLSFNSSVNRVLTSKKDVYITSGNKEDDDDD